MFDVALYRLIVNGFHACQWFVDGFLVAPKCWFSMVLDGFTMILLCFCSNGF